MTTVTTPEAELGQPQLIFRYAHHAVGERRRADLADGAYLGYEYNALGELQLARRFWTGGQLVAGQQFAYEFDHMGNRVFTQAGGDTAGAGLRLAQYVERVEIGVPGAPAREGRLWLAPNPESFTYDNDGNLTQDGRWRYTWDGENRLLKIESLPNAPAHSARSIAFTYDYRGRLVQREEAGAARTRFAYNGWQCVAELDATTNPAAPTLARSYLWGVDMAGWGGGAADGAGGVGGLIAVHSPAHGVHFCAYDGNGNVVGLVDSTGEISARYDYDPFGGPLRVSGQPIAYDNPFRFSTKRTDPTTDLVHYEYRVYSPTLGRWLSRDPYGENGGVNLCGFVGNNPMGFVDTLGLYEIDVHYYLTYWLASKIPCFSNAEAKQIANADQGTDENPGTAPGLGSTEKQRQQNRKYHALHPPGDGQNYLGELWGDATERPIVGQRRYSSSDPPLQMRRNCDLNALGIYLHHVQDTFSHRGFESDVYGHARRIHSADKTAHDYAKSAQMAAATWDTLHAWVKTCRCQCYNDKLNGRILFISPMGQQLTDFLEASGGPARRQINREEIDRKRGIIGVDPR